MAVDDLNRRVYGSRRVGRVLSGEDRFEKEALEGHPGGELAELRRQRLAGGPPAPGKKRFAEVLEQGAAGEKPRRR